VAKIVLDNFRESCIILHMKEVVMWVGFAWGCSGLLNVLLLFFGDIWPRIFLGKDTKPWMKKWSWWLVAAMSSFFILMLATFILAAITGA
jgi:hypothetical protein